MTSDLFQIGMLHRVLPELANTHGPDGAYSITTANLEAWLKERTDWWKPTPDELLQGNFPGRRPGLLLTFDDGFRDFAEHALPLLEEHQVSALLFVVNDFASGEREPYERLIAKLSPTDWQERRLAIKSLAPTQQWQIVADLATANGVNSKDLFAHDLLNWSEIAELDQHPLVTVGAHGKSHAYLPGLSMAAARQEMTESFNTLERILKRKPEHYSYAYGAHNWRLRRLVKKIGFPFAFTTEAKPLANRDLRKCLALPRQDLAQCTQEVP